MLDSRNKSEIAVSDILSSIVSGLFESETESKQKSGETRFFFFFFFFSCISLFRIAFTHHNHDTYWNSIFNTAQQKFCTNIGQGHNLCKPKTFIT